MRCDIKKTAIFLFACFFLALPCIAENEVAITVNGDNIYKDEFDYALARYEDSYRRHFGDNIDDSVREKMKKELIDDLVEKQLYLQEAKRRGITAKMFAGEEEIEELLMLNPRTSAEAEADRDRAEKVILAFKARQIIPPKVIAALREDVSADDKEVNDEYLKRAEKIRAKYLKVDPFEIANNMEISLDEVKAYYREHGDLFRRPEIKKYAALFFDPIDYAGMVSVTPKMCADYYNEHFNEFKSDKLARARYVVFRTKDYLNQVIDLGVNPERYYQDNLDKFMEPAEAKIRFISLKKPCDAKKLQALRNDMKQGVPFPELAKNYSDDQASAENGGDLGFIKEGTLKEPYNGIAFGLSAGQVSDIIDIGNSYCVFFVEEKKEGHVVSFDEAKDGIEEQLLNEAAKPLALTDAKRFKIEARKTGFEKAAAKKRLTVFVTDYLSSSDRVPGIGRNLSFTTAALDGVSGEASNEIEYDDGYAVLETMDVKPQYQLTTSEVMDSIERSIMAEGSAIYARAAANQALNLISEGVPINELKNRMSVHVTMFDASSTAESPADIGTVVNKNDGYYVTVLATTERSYIPDFIRISDEVAAATAFTKADMMAEKKANWLLKSGAITGEAAVETSPFSGSDYVIDGEYMRPFIEQCFTMDTGRTDILKSLGKYYIAQVIERDVQLAGSKDDSAVIRSQVLKEKKAEYSDNWLKKEREKAQVKVNL